MYAGKATSSEFYAVSRCFAHINNNLSTCLTCSANIRFYELFSWLSCVFVFFFRVSRAWNYRIFKWFMNLVSYNWSSFSHSILNLDIFLPILYGRYLVALFPWTVSFRLIESKKLRFMLEMKSKFIQIELKVI